MMGNGALGKGDSRRIVQGLVMAWALLLLAPIATAQSKKEGRAALREAGSLAAAGKCNQAIAKYDVAYAVFHDPVILFNRAECFRAMNEADKAIADYQAFLAALPQAPNRTVVQSRIVELGGAPTPAEEPVVDGPIDEEPIDGESVGESLPDSEEPLDLSPRPQLRDGERAPHVSQVHLESPPARDDDGGISPWVWVAVGAAVVAVGVTAGILLAGGEDTPSPPGTTLGNFKF